MLAMIGCLDDNGRDDRLCWSWKKECIVGGGGSHPEGVQ